MSGSGLLRSTTLLLLLAHVSTYIEREATIGGDVTLPCTVDFSGMPQVMWLSPHHEPLTRNEQVITADKRFSVDHPYQSEWNLEIRNVKSADQGNYTCMISSTPVQKKIVHLTIVLAPSISSSSDDVEVHTGSNVTIYCEAEGTPNPVISWYRYTYIGHKLAVGVEGENLTLSNVTHQIAGTYECQADNGILPTASVLIRVDVTFSPIITLPHHRISQEEDKDTFLQCSITANPFRDIRWEHNGRIIRESEKYQVTVQETGHYNRSVLLFVHDLAEDDFGTYTCVGENEFGRDQADMELVEWQSGHVRLIWPPEDVISSDGLTVIINCTVEQMNHKDSVAWWHYVRPFGYVRLFESHPAASRRQVVYLDSDKYAIVGHYNLIVKNVSLADGGEYMCELVGRANHSAFITVVDQLVCEQQTNTSVIYEGDFASLACSMRFSGPVRLWHSVWKRGNLTMSSVDEDVDVYIQRTVTFPAYSKDSGTYTCVISNKKPAYYSQCDVEVQITADGESPEPVCKPMDWNLSPSDLFVITAGCIAGITLLFSLILAVVCWHFKKQLRSNRSLESSPHKLNGDVNLETSRLTATEANEQEV